MGEAWYNNLGPEDRRYEEAVEKITNAVKQGLSFEQALELADLKDEEMRAAVADDSLKLLIAELHFAGEKTVKEVAVALSLPVEEVEAAKEAMLDEVEQSAIDAYKSEMGQSGNA